MIINKQSLSKKVSCKQNMADRGRNTVQRDVIERVVCTAWDHPTADAVYQRVKDELPYISLATVYRILRKMVAEGVIQEVTMQNGASVFDKTTVMHAHLVCKQCGAIEDVFLDEKSFMASIKSNGGFKLQNAQITFDGLCTKCADKTALCKASQRG